MKSIWRHASRAPTIMGIPFIAFLPCLIWLFHMTWGTFYSAIGIIIVFAGLAKLGWTFRVLWERFLHILRGSRIYARPWWYRNRFRDE
ncbi:IcmT/TraK family protein [Pseudomonas asuensis]|uniref:IcmT/TraK family protein n=1 Tax=Pseudomonas asuensis TaxID=1825787 RepID=UPI00227D2F67|nr:IcmT/TraK family protein [Pseudomonas asuensis]